MSPNLLGTKSVGSNLELLDLTLLSLVVLEVFAVEEADVVSISPKAPNFVPPVLNISNEKEGKMNLVVSF